MKVPFKIPKILRLLAQGASWISLAVLVLMAALFATGKVTLERMKWVFTLVTVVWFVAASMWMWESNSKGSQ